MSHYRLWYVLATLVGICASGISQTASAQTVFYVKTGATGTGSGLNWTDAFPNLQSALTTAGIVAGGGNDVQLWVAAGIYKPAANGGLRTATFTMVNRVGLYGGFAGTESLLDQRNIATNPTILSGDLNDNDGANFTNYTENSYNVVVASGVDATAVLDGFTIKGGNANHVSLVPQRSGGGLYANSGNPTIRNCTITLNRAVSAGGAYFIGASGPSLDTVQVSYNAGITDHGGMQIENASGGPYPNVVIRTCTFVGNTAPATAAGGGGGMALSNCDANVENCLFSDNVAARGAGLSLNGGGTISIHGSSFIRNIANGPATFCKGAGLYLNGGIDNVVVQNCVFDGNRATNGVDGTGAGLQINDGCDNAKLANLIIVGNVANQGGGLFTGSPSTTIRNVTLVSNAAATGGGVYLIGGTGNATLTNCILWGNTASSGAATSQIAVVGPAAAVSYSLVQGAWPGTGNLNVDPLFRLSPSPGADGNWDGVNDNYGDTRLLATSPAIDAGSNALVATDALDLDNDGNTTESIPVDVGGRGRFRDVIVAANTGAGTSPLVDMGAYESVAGPIGTDNTPSPAWASGTTSLQGALAFARAYPDEVSEIWVAAGTYKPDIGSGITLGDRAATFDLVSNVSIYGGFTGSETARDQRNPATNVTILSGDLLGNDAAYDPFVSSTVPPSWDDNSFHVVRAVNTNSATILDGFTITHGRANGAGNDAKGAGFLDQHADVVIRNCIMEYNVALDGGGGAHLFDPLNQSFLTRFERCTFKNNRATNGVSNAAGGLDSRTGDVVVEDCAFTQNRGCYGGACAFYSTNLVSVAVAVRRCTFDDNSACSVGAGIFVSTASATHTTISECQFTANRSGGHGGAISLNNGNVDILNSKLRGNSAIDGGAIRLSTNPLTGINIVNSEFVGNTAHLGAAAYAPLLVSGNGSLARFTNCTFVANVATTDGGALWCSYGAGPVIKNCILWNNVDSGGMDSSAQIHVASGSPTVDFSLIQGGWTGASGVGILTYDPLFIRNPSDGGDGWGDSSATPLVDESLNDDFGDLRLRFGSAAIDHADNTAVPLDTHDLDGDANTIEPLPLDLTGKMRFVDLPCITDTGIGAAPQADVGAYEYAYNVAIAPVILVKSGATGDGSGLTWANAVTDLQDAICAASTAAGAIREIWVAAGTHRPTSRSDQTDPRSARFTLANGTTIYGGFLGNEALLEDRDPAANVTILSGDLDANDDYNAFPFGTSMDNNAYHVVNADGVDFTAELDGVTIHGGKAVDSADPLTTGNTHNQGGGLHSTNGSPTILRCTFDHNVALQGGGAFSGSSANPEFEDCAFTANSAIGIGSDGGGVYTSSAGSARPMVENCSFESNTAADSGGAIGVSNNSPLVSRSTFRLNRADRGGALFSNSASAHPQVFSCLFNGNQAVQHGGAIGISGGNATVCNCTFAGNTAIGVANGQGNGGAIFSNAAPATYINCTLSGNVAGLAAGLTDGGLGGGFFLASSPAATVLNTIVWYNTDRLGVSSTAQITLQSSAPTVSTSDVQGGWAGAGAGNLNAEPLFITVPTPGPDGLWNNVGDDYGNLQLQAISPCVDTGDDASVPPDACDLDCDANVVETMSLDLSRGNRFIDTPGVPSPPPPLPQLVDIGAYERGAVPSERVYVKAGATGAGNGSDWANAFPELRTALANIATLGCEDIQIWVAAGRYKPAPIAGSRNATFQLIDGVEILGGFAGTETLASQRDADANVTVLSGDLNDDDPGTLDNVHHVVTGSGVTSTAVLDGFTIRGGQADSLNGGGFLTLSGGPTLRHCRILANGGGCGADFATAGGFVTLDGTTLTSTSGGVSLSQTTLDLQGPLHIAAGRLDSFGNTLRGVGTLNLAAGTSLHVQSGPPCGAELASNAVGSMNAAPLYSPNVTGPPAVPAQWNLTSVPIHDVIITGGAHRWVIAPSAQGASATLTWISPLLQDLSTGNRAEATFHEGGLFQIVGDLYDASVVVPTPIVTGTVLLTGNVAAFRVRETGTTSNAFAFTQAPILLPTGGYLVTNSSGFVLAGNQTLGLGASFTCLGPVNDFAASIVLSGATPLTLAPVNAPQTQTILRSNITGTGSIMIDPGAELLVLGGALLDLSGSLPGQGCADVTNAGAWGTVDVNGSLIVRDSTVQNSNVDVKIGSLEGVTTIVNNDCRLPSTVSAAPSRVPFGGEFFVSGTSIVQCNVIQSDGDRYLDLDPDPSAMPRPAIGQGSNGNKITVNIRQGSGQDQGELLELRSVDWDYMAVGGGQSGARLLASSAGNNVWGGGGYTDAWVLEKLEVFDNAKVNLTNRQGFVFQNPAIPIPEAIYVKTIKLHPGAVLNTGLQRMYFQTLVNENNATLTVNPNDPHGLLANGSRIVDVPLLGFSLKVIAMEDDTEFGVRLRTRLRDNSDVQPPAAPFKEGEVVRVAAPLPGNALNHAMAMRTSKTSCSPGAPPCPSASSIAAHGAFARAGEAQIEIKFNYKFCGQAADELIVYLSDSPDVLSGSAPSPNLVEVARLYPPASGPGSIASNDFAVFSGRFPRDALNFTRGTYVELELRGLDACVLIDDFDPLVCGSPVCGDLGGQPAFDYTVTGVDFLYLLSQQGLTAGSSNLCVDRMSSDKYVDLGDVLQWDAQFHSPNMNLCGTGGSNGGAPAQVGSTIPSAELLIAGKQRDLLAEPGVAERYPVRLYGLNPLTGVAMSGILPPAAPLALDAVGHGRLMRSPNGELYQLHGAYGMLRLSNGVQRIAPAAKPCSNPASTVHVGFTQQGDKPLFDAAFDPNDPTVVYIVPVRVIPTAAPSQVYMAAARVRLLSPDGNYSVERIFGLNPWTDNSNNTTPPEFASANVQKVREVEVDGLGNLFVISALADNTNNWLLLYRVSDGFERRIPLGTSPAAPTALLISADGAKLFIASGQTGANETQTTVYRYTIVRSGNEATNVTLDGIYTITGMRQVTSLGLGASGSIHAVGYQAPSFTTDYAFNEGDPLFTTPALATLPAAAPPQTVPAQAITGSDLSLPMSVILANTGCPGPMGDFNGDQAVTPADVPGFINVMLNGTGGSAQTLCRADFTLDGLANGRDITGFVQAVIP